MKGNNQFDLNEATLIEAVQEYFDKRMPIYGVVVKSVKSSRVGLSDGFTIHVEERPSATPNTETEQK